MKKMKKCKNHKFESDGGQCFYCGKTVTELMNEKQEKNISIYGYIFSKNKNKK